MRTLKFLGWVFFGVTTAYAGIFYNNPKFYLIWLSVVLIDSGNFFDIKIKRIDK